MDLLCCPELSTCRFYAAINVGAIISSTVVVNVQTNVRRPPEALCLLRPFVAPLISAAACWSRAGPEMLRQAPRLG